jgi:disulfide bond formation protein DsbB
VHEIDLNGVKWVEGVHYNSELKGFFTHYFITVVDPYAVLVTISVHESAYPAAMAKLKPTIDSIKVNAPQPTNGPKTKSQSPPAETPVADSDTDVVPKRGRATIRILGLNIPRPLAFVAIGFLAVLILLLYAIKKD